MSASWTRLAEVLLEREVLVLAGEAGAGGITMVDLPRAVSAEVAEPSRRPQDAQLGPRLEQVRDRARSDGVSPSALTAPPR